MFLAIDAGGTSTRAVLVDPTGHCHGYGRAGSGNPTSSGISAAADSIARAAEQALAGLDRSVPLIAATLAMAGEQTPAYAAEVTERLGRLGVPQVDLDHDLLAIFCSGTPDLEGYALIAGTGTVAAEVAGGQLARVVGGRGWLLGDAGSGYWIGHQVARAVVAALDGQAPPTELTTALRATLGLAPDAGVRPMVSALYARPPIRLAEFAPLAFALAHDQVAAEILRTAAVALADLLTAVRRPDLDGPVVGGGSVLLHGVLASPTLTDLATREATPLIPVPDGVLGAAVLALRRAGLAVDDRLFPVLQTEVERIRPTS